VKVARVAALLAVVASLLVASPARAAVVLTVWVSASGSDANDGSQASPVLTIARVQDILRTADPDGDVEVRIDQGTYVAGQTTWDYYNGHTITFMPDDYEIGEGVSGIAGRPVFAPDGSAGYWLVAKIPTSYQGGDLTAKLRFYYLHVEGYGQGGLMFYGRTSVVDGFRVPGSGLDGNVVVGMFFTELGSAWGTGLGYGGVSLSNSSGNWIGNNHFRDLENVAPSAAGIHGIYALHGSGGNTVAGNAFHTISGHPMRTRNQSNGNNVYGNVFTATGAVGYSEWFCDAACVAANPGSVLECASHSNVFHDNDLVSGYGGGTLGEYWLSPSGLTNPGPAGCPALPGDRATVYGNF
jgi:hypothetical protein